MRAAEAARGLLRRGWRPVPLLPGSKRPLEEGWQSRLLDEEDIAAAFAPREGGEPNVGVLLGEPSNWVVDVDLDVDEARAVADALLPGPTLESGRPGAPRSHRWYVAEGAQTLRLRGVGGEVIVELRASGQTLAPPSRHPSGERVAWGSDSQRPLRVRAEELAGAVREVAAAALIVRHMPPVGGRHDYALALAGLLARAGVPTERAERVMVAAWEAVSHKDPRAALGDVRNALLTTAQRHTAGEPVQGGAALEELAPGLPRALTKVIGAEASARGGRPRNVPPLAERLIDYGLEDAEELFRDQHGEPHALSRSAGPVPLATSRANGWLRRLLWQRERGAAHAEALITARGVLAAKAEFEGEMRTLHVRFAGSEDRIYCELRPGRVVEVAAGGWRVLSCYPVLFRRLPTARPMPDPVAGGSLESLCDLVRLRGGRDRRLLLAYAVTVPAEHIPRPILLLTGPAGSGKTTLARMLKQLLDPGSPEFVTIGRDFVQAADHSALVVLDNLGSLAPWVVDTLCRMVTGEGQLHRRLYTDDEAFVRSLRRAVVMTAINTPSEREDFLDRTLNLELARIDAGGRRTEAELLRRFEESRAELLGALFDALAATLARVGTLELDQLPRLADWGRLMAAAYEALGFAENGLRGAELFNRDFSEAAGVGQQAALDGSPIAAAVVTFMGSRREYAAPPAQLHRALEKVAETLGVDTRGDRRWPRSARWLWRRLREATPVLEAHGIEARRVHQRTGTMLELRRVTTDRASVTTDRGSVTTDDAANVTGFPHSYAENSQRDNSDNRFPNFSERSGVPHRVERDASFRIFRKNVVTDVTPGENRITKPKTRDISRDNNAARDVTEDDLLSHPRDDDDLPLREEF